MIRYRMKKIFTLILALTCVLGLGGCGRSMNDVINNEPNFTGVVAEVTDENIIVNINKDDAIYSNYKVVVVSLDVELNDGLTSYSVGDEVTVYYDGNIAEGAPAKADTVYAICLITTVEREENNKS